MRKLEFLAKYDDNLTIAQLRQSLEKEEQISAEKELKEEENIKSKFENKYFKYLNKQSLFGVELEICKFENLVRKERNTDWEFIYYFNGSKISFSEREAYMRDFDPDRCGDSISSKDLEVATEITEEEYNLYLEKYKVITNELKYIVNGK